MQGSLYNDGFDVLESDLDNTETTKSNEIKRRTTDLSASPNFGVVTGLDVVQPQAVGFTLVVNVGFGYDEDGEFVNIPVGTAEAARSVTIAAIDVGELCSS